MILATLMLDQLENTEQSEVISKLDHMPQTVELYYAREARRIYEEARPFNRKYLKQIVSWVVWASEDLSPLHVQALIEDKYWDEEKVRYEIKEGCLARYVSIIC